MYREDGARFINQYYTRIRSLVPVCRESRVEQSMSYSRCAQESEGHRRKRPAVVPQVVAPASGGGGSKREET